jgi:hypothetical protein
VTKPFDPARSRALWNRDRLDLASDEIYRRVKGKSSTARKLRGRILRLCREGAVSFPHLFIAAMGALGESVDPYPEVRPREDREALA